MKNLQTLQAKYREFTQDFANAEGLEDGSYRHGKMIGFVEAVSFAFGITWIEAEVLLRNTQ
jgi:hypothetical protein